MDRNLALEVVRVTEAAALACARFMGRGDEKAAGEAAADAMRKAFKTICIDGTVVIGEGEREEAPALYVGDKVGTGDGPVVDVALDPLDGTSLCANGGPNAMSIIAMGGRGSFLHCPNIYMEKIAAGPEAMGVIDLDQSPTKNLLAVAEAKRKRVEDLTVVILHRPRHERLIREVRQAGARIKLISDGDIAAAIATSEAESGIDLLMGTGGAGEGVLAAAALRCRGGEMQARLRPKNQQEAERAKALGIQDIEKKYSIGELAGGEVVVAATGVTDGDYVKGVRFFGAGARTQSVVMRSKTSTLRVIDATHTFALKPKL
ncbi:MAG: class II fructose-bisphosphatase [Candidatus Binatia bacterium]